MSEATHTPTPWRYITHQAVGGNDYIQLLSGSWDIAHTKYSARQWEEEIANAELIVTAVNSHATLVAAVEAAEKALDALTSVLYGQNLRVAGWHQNGDLQSMDSFFEDNVTGEELGMLRAALAAVRT